MKKLFETPVLEVTSFKYEDLMNVEMSSPTIPDLGGDGEDM